MGPQLSGAPHGGFSLGIWAARRICSSSTGASYTKRSESLFGSVFFPFTKFALNESRYVAQFKGKLPRLFSIFDLICKNVCIEVFSEDEDLYGFMKNYHIDYHIDTIYILYSV